MESFAAGAAALAFAAAAFAAARRRRRRCGEDGASSLRVVGRRRIRVSADEPTARSGKRGFDERRRVSRRRRGFGVDPDALIRGVWMKLGGIEGNAAAGEREPLLGPDVDVSIDRDRDPVDAESIGRRSRRRESF